MLPASTGVLPLVGHRGQYVDPQAAVSEGGFSSLAAFVDGAMSMRSLSRQLFVRLSALSGGRARVIGRFRRVIDLAIGDDVVALTTPEIGNGPFHLVLDRLPPADFLPSRFPLFLEEGWLHLGPLALHVDDPPPLWDARPNWKRLRPHPSALLVLQEVVRQAAAERPSPFTPYLLGEAMPRLRMLKAAWAVEREALEKTVASLAGWGLGLTPSGDDFIAGMMLALWADCAALTPRAAFLYRVAAPRTTLLSRAFLRAARDGLADAHWHALLRALAMGEAAAVRRAAEVTLTFGATSGVDMAAGFLFYWFDLGGDGNPHRSLPPGHSLIQS